MLLKNLTKKEKKGIFFGMGSPFFYAIDSVLDILLFAVVFGIGFRSQLSLWQTIVYAFITSFFKDFLLFFIVSIQNKMQALKLFFKLKKEKKRAFWWTILGSLCGGPLGLTLTTATILYSGAAYGSALANFSPIIVLLFATYFFRTKLNWKCWLGIGLAILGFVGIAFFSSFINGDSLEFNLRIFIGVIMAVLAVLTWSIETIVAEYTEKFGPKNSLNTNEKLIIKSTISTTSNLFFFIPFSLLCAFIAKETTLVFSMLETLFTSWESWLILIIIGIAVTFGRISYWISIANIGGGRADILYYLTVLTTPILVLILSAAHVIGFSDPLGVHSYVYWILLACQILGVFLITIYSKNNQEHLFRKNNIK